MIDRCALPSIEAQGDGQPDMRFRLEEGLSTVDARVDAEAARQVKAYSGGGIPAVLRIAPRTPQFDGTESVLQAGAEIVPPYTV